MTFKLSPKTALLLSIALLPVPAYAQDAGDSSKPSDIVVTGTRVSERTTTTSPVPIDVLQGEEIRASGYQETTEILRQLAPSFAFATPTTPDGNTHIHNATLRGLSPDATLVLVNGRRLHTAAWVNTGGTIGKGSTPTDLNQVPAASIGRVDLPFFSKVALRAAAERIELMGFEVELHLIEKI